MSSSYYKTLSDECKKRYTAKLSFNSFALPDPLDEDLRKTVYVNKRWPSISVFDIFSYLVVKHQMYSKPAFKDYTCLPCYNYVTSGKVKSIRCYRNDVGVCIVTADVEASQTAKKIHFPWIIAKFDGEILSGHCTCMAGLGETCAHVGAVLFFIEKTLTEEREKPACTSEPCKWNKTSTNVEPSPVTKINFSKPKLSKPILTVANALPRASDAQFQTFLRNAKAALPTAALFLVSSDSDGTETGDEEIPNISEEEVATFSATTFLDKAKNFLLFLPQESTLLEKQKFFETTFLISESDRKAIEIDTKLHDMKWKAERKARITASNFGAILKCKNSHDSIILDIMGYRNDIHNNAIGWGKKMEKIARDKFSQMISPLHVNLCIQSTGLFVDKEEPYLAATPDGFVTCDCCEDHVLEIKCPFLHRSKKIQDIEKKKFFLDENEILKENHQYYEQIQGQMAILGVTKCYFVTYTEKQLHYQIVEFDELRWENSKRILRQFFYKFVFPEIVNSEISNALKAAAEECICKSEKCSTVVKCHKCRKTFHKACVAFRKRLSWLCDECKIKV